MPEENPVPVHIPPPPATPVEHRADADAFVVREAIAYLARVKAGLERSRQQG